ncbi:unnamed protein product [Dibothriocephalus latus]|uniref:Uncharacterized protein n=1 Tax=Dibothriocephalus latus TaxID=60516 RepID=A0A3P7M3S8_DIBLA|nr:unnamed protein product [Dibothriocephalus latus]
MHLFCLKQAEVIRAANFGGMAPVTIDWFHLVRSCDEILLPRCSWPHFLNLFQAIGQDNELMKYATFSNFDAESWMVPMTRHACYPMRSQDQMSANYIYAVCIVYWNETGFERDSDCAFHHPLAKNCPKKPMIWPTI